MEIALEALIEYTEDNLNSFTTVEEYDGHIDANGMKKTIDLPAVLYHGVNGYAKQNPKGINFRALVISESREFDKKENRKTNLTYVNQLMDFLSLNPGFTYTVRDESYSFEIDANTIRFATLLVNDRFVIHNIDLNIKYLL